ncbi:cytochrome c oxidase subunit 7A2, mitochondrial [Anomaloglossus baeobatrachus]|uniref:cytochrome c oxidase subunit 7A2, mitochondrial n=1 Tax=Anomaloglossus baeobatrachus TaxID=238106 RepID=UPI003F4F79AE
MFRHLQSLRQISQRTISSSSRRSLPNKVPEKQKLFQADNGLPVHLKAGTGDLLLYRLTMGITIFGAAYALYEIVMASFPKKQN